MAAPASWGSGTRRCATAPVHWAPSSWSGSTPHVPSTRCTRRQTSASSTPRPAEQDPEVPVITPTAARRGTPELEVPVATGEEDLRTRGTDTGVGLQRRDQRAQPARFDGGVVVHQRDVVDVARGADPPIASGAEADVLEILQDLDGRELRPHPGHHAVFRRVVHQDDPERAAARPCRARCGGTPWSGRHRCSSRRRRRWRDGPSVPTPRCLSGSHHQRLSRYHATVASSASSSVRSRCQPSAVTFAMSTEYRRSWPEPVGDVLHRLLALAEQRQQLVDQHAVRASRCRRRCCRSRRAHRARARSARPRSGRRRRSSRAR